MVDDDSAAHRRDSEWCRGTDSRRRHRGQDSTNRRSVKPHAFHPEADAGYAAAARYYAEIQPELGGRFYDEIETSIALLCAHPRQFREFDPPARRSLSRHFPYAVVYVDQPEQVWIVAVLG